ncbi:S1 family peptidase [Amycolatopsis sp. CA-230715]|uniref:S1 family peptidase n=1 Tax=Amycolatopsis sp. CA-230715 TaxID=2745196 RepID=UPI001C02EBBE|nr:serine protease [Amycolatopsis sp. CA-230715]QWF77915.1 hypothetical protein HUW46_01308 [Amycolatopsis sp. CA-230715]
MRLRVLGAVVGLFAAVVAPLAGSAGSVGTAAPLIVGGNPASEDYSFYTKLFENGAFSCGAVLVAPEWLATAKHCVTRRHPDSVRVGGTSLGAGEPIPVEQLVPGPGGEDEVFGADFALIKLAEPAKSAPITITAAPLEPGLPIRVIGHGQTCAARACGPPPEQLQELDTTLVTGCRRFHADSELCVGDPSGKGICYGDSGGPLVTEVDGRWELGGTTSRLGGLSSTCAEAPSVYNKVPYYRQWIEAHTGPLP